MLLCSATGNPEPKITWLKDYVPVDTTDPRVKVLPTGISYYLFVELALCQYLLLCFACSLDILDLNLIC